MRRHLTAGLAIAIGLFFPLAAQAGFEKLQGSFTGGTDETTTTVPPGGSPTSTEDFGAISGDMKSQSLGKTGSFLFVVVTSASSAPLLVKLNFKSKGRVTTSALVPGLINIPAAGKWKARAGGTTIKFTLTATTADGTYMATGILKGNGKSLGLKITATSSITSTTAPNAAQIIFVGDRDKS